VRGKEDPPLAPTGSEREGRSFPASSGSELNHRLKQELGGVIFTILSVYPKRPTVNTDVCLKISGQVGQWGVNPVPFS
jgi:hypothetical protein